MMRLNDRPDAPFDMPNGSTVIPVATLSDEDGSASHIILDDGCYVLVNDTGDGHIFTTNHWFDEAVEAMRRLPPPSEKKAIIVSRMENGEPPESFAR